MKTYIISYQLRHFDKNYMPFYQDIKDNYPNKWFHILEESWFIKTDDSAEEIYKKIKTNLAEDDSIFISEIIMDNKAGWMARSGWDFLKKPENEEEYESLGNSE